MLNILVYNPFRILGVYSNATKKEITANATKLRAFLKVNKAMSFPADLSWKMGELQRSADIIDDTLAKINLPNDKITHALFRFINVNPLDKVALSHLEAGNEEKAKEIWNKKACFSSSLNLAVLALVNDDIDTYIAKVTCLIHDDNLRIEFVNGICDDTFQISEDDLAHKMMDALLTEINASELYNKFVSYGTPADDEYLKDKAVAEPISRINTKIDKAKSIPNNDATANYNAGVGLINATKDSLKKVKEIVGEDDSTYERVADNLAQTILQCGINYYNNTDDDDDVEKALYIQRKALAIAVGTIAKDRCKENVSILKKKKALSKIQEDLDAVANELKAFQRKMQNITNAQELVNKCQPYLLNISSALGSTNELYLKISSAVANNALGMLISVVNNAQSGTPNLAYLASTIRSAMSLMDEIGELAMTAEERKHFTTNKTTLSSMQVQVSHAITSSMQVHVSHTIPSSSSDSNTTSGSDINWGCIIGSAFILFYMIMIIAFFN